MAQRATQWHITSKKRNIDIQLPVLICCSETISCFKMGIDKFSHGGQRTNDIGQ